MTSAVQSAPAKSPVARILSTGALVLAVVAILLPVIDSESLSLHLIGTPSVAVAVGAALVLLVAYRFSGVGRVYACLGLGGVSYALAFALIGLVSRHAGDAGAGFWAYVVVAWAMAWLCVEEMAALEPRDPTIQRLVSLAIPLMFGIWLLLVWQLLVVGFGVPRVLLPPPSEVWLRLLASPEVLWKDFQQTFLKGVLIGYTIGCGSGFLVAILVDRVPFLRRGLLPLAISCRRCRLSGWLRSW